MSKVMKLPPSSTRLSSLHLPCPPTLSCRENPRRISLWRPTGMTDPHLASPFPRMGALSRPCALQSTFLGIAPPHKSLLSAWCACWTESPRAPSGWAASRTCSRGPVYLRRSFSSSWIPCGYFKPPPSTSSSFLSPRTPTSPQTPPLLTP